MISEIKHLSYTVVHLALIAGWSLAITAEAQTTAEEQPATLPPAKQIMDDYVEALGGADKLAGVTTRHMKGLMKMPLHGVQAPLEIWHRSPDSMVATVELPGMGSTRQGVHGDTAWDVNPLMGVPRLLEGKEKAHFLKQADLQADLHFDKYYMSMKTVEAIEIDGRPHYKVELTTLKGDKETRYFDAESHLLTKVEQKVTTVMGEVELVEKISDYRSIDGIMLPHKTQQQVMGTDMEVEFESVKLNIEIDDSIFAIPDDVQQLIDQAEPSQEE